MDLTPSHAQQSVTFNTALYLLEKTKLSGKHRSQARGGKNSIVNKVRIIAKFQLLLKEKGNSSRL